MSGPAGLWLLVVAFVVVLTLLTGAAPAWAQATIFRERIVVPFAIDDVNPCTGEAVSIEGELTITVQDVADAQGGEHFTFTLVPHLVRGVGESGATYKAVGGARSHFNFTPGGVFNETLTDTFNLISQGGSDNFVTHFVFHVTVNANGELTVVVIQEQAECRG